MQQVSVNSCKARSVQLVYDRLHICVSWVYLILLYTRVHTALRQACCLSSSMIFSYDTL